MNSTKDRDFTRPKGNSNEFRSKYIIHRLSSGLLNRSDAVRAERARLPPFSLQKSPNRSIGKKMYKYDEDKLFRTRNKTKRAQAQRTSLSQVKGKLKPNQSISQQYNNSSIETSIDHSIHKNQSMMSANNRYRILNTKLHPQYNSDIKSYISKDINKPQGYDDYIHQFKMRDMVKKAMNGNRSKLRLQKNVSAVELNAKGLNSAIFYLKQPKDDPSSGKSGYVKQSRLAKIENNQSDIFFKSNDSKSHQKSGEAYLFVKPSNEKYTGGESESFFVKEDINHSSLINHSNVEFNILNPTVKSASMSKSQIMSHSGTDEYKIARRKKGAICSYLDMTRVGVSNSNKKLVQSYERSKNCFHRTKSLCSAFIDLQKHYRNLVQKPFALGK